MTLICRQAKGLAFLAILVASAGVLVGCGAGPGAKAQPDPVEIPDVSRLDIGKTHNVSLVNKFSGEELNYTATSNNEAVATVEVDNAEDILTVTAVGEGKATITVTAKNPQGTIDQTFSVTVPKPTTSGAPTVRTGASGSVDVDQGDTETVTLGRVFTGEDLEFSVSSSDTDVATASIDDDDGILTISARSPGEATITVTATNDDGNAAYRITVNVPTPVEETLPPSSTNNQSNCQSPLTIHRLVNDTEKCTLPTGHTMSSTVPPAELEVRESTDSADTDNVWLIIGKKRGTYTVTIFNAGVFAYAITVVVPNIPPKRKSDVENPSEVMGLSNAKPDGGTVDLDLETYFTDDDGDTWRYRIKKGGKPDWVLINTKDGFIHPVSDGDEDFVRSSDAASKLMLEVLKKVEAGKHFTVSLYAVDDSGGESERSVTLKFGSAEGSEMFPREVPTYMATQTKDGSFRAKNGELIETALKVGPRRGVDHTLTFMPYDLETGFRLANKLVEDWSENLTTDQIGNLPGTSVEAPETPAIGDGFFTLDSTTPSSMKVKWSGGTASTAIQFKLEKGSPGSIRLKYSLYVSSKKRTDGSNFPQDAMPRLKTNTMTLNVTVVTCSSPPAPIEDCP